MEQKCNFAIKCDKNSRNFLKMTKNSTEWCRKSLLQCRKIAILLSSHRGKYCDKVPQARREKQTTTMISVLVTAVATPFMMADQSAAPAAPAALTQNTPDAYNWVTQNAQEILTDEDVKVGATGSFSFIPGSGGAQTVDDWRLC